MLLLTPKGIKRSIGASACVAPLAGSTIECGQRSKSLSKLASLNLMTLYILRNKSHRYFIGFHGIIVMQSAVNIWPTKFPLVKGITEACAMKRSPALAFQTINLAIFCRLTYLNIFLIM